MMNTYVIQQRETGEVVHAYTADAPSEFVEYPFAQFNHILQKPETVAPAERTITKVAYLRRFTTDERVGIRTAAKTSAVLEDYLSMMELAEEINLDDPDTIAAVQMLESAGLIAPGRAAEVLA